MSVYGLSLNAELHLLLCVADHIDQLHPTPLSGCPYLCEHKQSQKTFLKLWNFKRK